MAALAVIALGTTVFVAQRALSSASDVIVRGEGDLLVHAVASDLGENGGLPTQALLESELGVHGDEGLRYVAVIDRDGRRPTIEAGTATIPGTPARGESTVLGRRARATSLFIPPRRFPSEPGMSIMGRRPDRGGPPSLLVVEFEPPVIETLRGDLTRISVVAAGAGAVLLAFAIAWSRSASRLAAIERQAAREQRLVALGSMSSVMAHELRNPLTSLKGHAQLLVEDLDGDDKKRARAERVVTEAERLESLTSSLLDFVRDGPVDVTPIAPSELVERSLEHLPSSRVRVDVSEAPAALLVDGTRLARAVHNLVDNALQATEDGEVDLRIARADRDVLIAVRDRGPGLPSGSPIFEPFITTRVRGTGLGLPVARRIAEQHGGTLVGANHPSGGAIFELRFPAAEGDA